MALVSSAEVAVERNSTTTSPVPVDILKALMASLGKQNGPTPTDGNPDPRDS